MSMLRRLDEEQEPRVLEREFAELARRYPLLGWLMDDPSRWRFDFSGLPQGLGSGPTAHATPVRGTGARSRPGGYVVGGGRALAQLRAPSVVIHEAGHLRMDILSTSWNRMTTFSRQDQHVPLGIAELVADAFWLLFSG